MDPSADLCLSYDTLKTEPPTNIKDIKYDNWISEPQTNLTKEYEFISINDYPKIINVNINNYNTLQKIKDAFDVEGFVDARNRMNPFENIGRSIFMNRAAIKIANIDAVHHVTNKIFTYKDRKSNDAFTFCDVAAGPGGFTQYLQYRFPLSKGYGMTLKTEGLDWNRRLLDMSRFEPFYGSDGTGDLYRNAIQFIDFVLKKHYQGVDLVMGDGGFELDTDQYDKDVYKKQEFLSSRLLLSQCLIGVGCTKHHGNFVVKLFDTVTNFSSQLIYLLSLCFNRITIFKPVSSRPANAEKYLICMDRNRSIQSYYQILLEAYTSYSDNIYIDSLYVEPPSKSFTLWITQNNNMNVNSQLIASGNILLDLKGQSPTLPEYNIPKFLIIWHLPDTPLHPKTSLIKIK